MLRFGKKGYIRTIEAVIAIVLILLFTYQILPRTTTPPASIPTTVEDAQNFIIQEIRTNTTLRDEILTIGTPKDCPTNSELNTLIQNNLPAGYSHTCRVCGETSGCLAIEDTPTDRSVYVKDTFIASTLSIQQPKIFKLFIWES